MKTAMSRIYWEVRIVRRLTLKLNLPYIVDRTVVVHSKLNLHLYEGDAALLDAAKKGVLAKVCSF